MSKSTVSTTAGYPVFSNRPHYIDGYDPSSLWAPHSSLQRTRTWLGMGLVLTSLAGFGTLVFGLASGGVGSQENWSLYATIGAVLVVACLVGGFGLIHSGRSAYRQYRAETGRVN